MAAPTPAPKEASVRVSLYNDLAKEDSEIVVTPALAGLLSYAHFWTHKGTRDDDYTLSFSSMLAALVAGEDRLCAWLRQHLALRGSSEDAVTRGRRVEKRPLPDQRFNTTISFRSALEEAESLAAGQTLDVRHFMAGYVVVPNYHRLDFLRLHIDRRAWCLELAGNLERTYPLEAAAWAAYAKRAPAVLLPVFDPDLPSGADLLGVGREVETFAMLVAGRDTLTPLSIGVFGPWGSGKSYFMARVEERVAKLSADAASRAAYFGRIAQIRFNAWHYSEGNIIASLVDQIVRNLSFGPDEDEKTLVERRKAVLAELSVAEDTRNRLERELKMAEDQETARRTDLDRVARDLDSAVQQKQEEFDRATIAVTDAQKRLAQTLEREAAAVEQARQKAPAQEALALVTRTILEDPQLHELEQGVRRAIDESRWVGLNQTTILIGIVVTLVTAFVAFAVAEAKETKLFTGLVGLVAALTPIATKWLAQLRELATKGEQYQTAVRARATAAVARIEEAGRQARADDEANLEQRRAEVVRLRADIAALPEKTRIAKLALGDSEARRQKASADLAAATASVATARAALNSVTAGSLLEEIVTGLATTDVYQKQLGTVARARTDFERLSRRMAKARKEFESDATGAPPVLDRIVLYIDDLDRCPKDKVQEVLRAVHLLLAFDLFVCVVAVDPRWVIQCLSESDGLMTDAPKNSDLEVLGGVATPSDYLEKIFQIPMWLRPVPAAQRAPIVGTLLGRAVERRVDPGAPFGLVRPGLKAANGEALASAGGTEYRSEPKALRIDPRELLFLASVEPLLDGNVRALKRFVNTYRLVKAALSDVEFDYFLTTPYRLCIAQLAILATQRQRARTLVNLVDNADTHSTTLEKWIAEMASQKESLPGALARDLQTVLFPPELPQGIRQELSKVTLRDFATWLERTRRYSFYL
jgi:hypothetical protein